MGVRAVGFFNHVDGFVDYRKDIYHTGEQTIKSNLIDLKLFERFILREKYKTVDGPVAMKFQYYLKKERNNCGGSINRKIYTLRSYSHFLRLQDVPKAEGLPFYDILKIRHGYRNRPNALTCDQVKRFFKMINHDTYLGIRDYAVYALMYQIGLRVGEVHSLDITSIDFENSIINVMGKGNKPRRLYLIPELKQILLEWLAVRRYFLNNDKSFSFFMSKKGNRLAIRTMEDNIKKILSKAKLNAGFNVTCHTLRHSFASHLNDKDVDILVIQSLLGHSSTRSTEPYIHPSLEKVRRAMEKLPGVIYMNELVKTGVLNLTFQTNRPKRE